MGPTTTPVEEPTIIRPGEQAAITEASAAAPRPETAEMQQQPPPPGKPRLPKSAEAIPDVESKVPIAEETKEDGNEAVSTKGSDDRGESKADPNRVEISSGDSRAGNMEIIPLEKATDSTAERNTALTDGEGSGAAEAGEPQPEARNAASEAPPKKTTLIQHIRKTWNSVSIKWDETEEDAENDDGAEAESSIKQVICRRIMDTNDPKQLDSIEFVVRAKMRTFLMRVHDWWCDPAQPESLKDLPSVTLPAPFAPFAWRWSAYVAAAEAKEEDDAEISEYRQILREMMAVIRKSNWLETFFRNRETVITTKRVCQDFHGSMANAKYGGLFKLAFERQEAFPSQLQRFRLGWQHLQSVRLRLLHQRIRGRACHR